MQTSKKYDLNAPDLRHLAKTLLAVILAALLTWATIYIPQIDFGAYTPIVMAVYTVLAKLGQYWLQNNQVQQTQQKST